MTHTLHLMREKIQSARNLLSVISTMKSLAGSTVSRFEEAVEALDDYAVNVQKGLLAYFLAKKLLASGKPGKPENAGNSGKRGERRSGSIRKRIVVLFGSDLAMVGMFNETLVEYCLDQHGLKENVEYWAVGERLSEALKQRGLQPAHEYRTPDSISSLKSTIAKIVDDLNYSGNESGALEVMLFYNMINEGIKSESRARILLPFNQKWFEQLSRRFPDFNSKLDIIYDDRQILNALVKEFLFVYLFRSCALAVMSENTTRLAYMEQAEKRIENTMEELTQKYRQLRQKAINKELFEVIAAYQAIVNE